MAFLRTVVTLCFLTIYVARGSHILDDTTTAVRESPITVYSEESFSSILHGFSNWPFGAKRKPRVESLHSKKQTLNLDAATVIAHLASISYCYKYAKVESWSCARCSTVPDFVIEHSIVDGKWDVHAYLGYYPPWKAKFIVFRGTDSSRLTNWIENLKANHRHVKLDIPGLEDCTVHSGFSRLWNIPLKQRVMAALEKLRKKYGEKGPLYVVGHSSGGAVAQISALYIKTLKRAEDIHLYTFGSPRVGNKAFAHKVSNLMAESWRFTHMRDVVPTMPWKNMGYWHCGQEVFQTDRTLPNGKVLTKYIVCDGSGEDSHGHNSMCPYWLGCGSISDHLHYMHIIMENDKIC